MLELAAAGVAHFFTASTPFRCCLCARHTYIHDYSTTATAGSYLDAGNVVK